MPAHFSSADLALARRVEAAEAANGFALARLTEGAEALPLLGGAAVFAGVGSPLTHALGIGMNGPVTAAEFDELEEFYRARGSPCLIDLCPMAELSVIEQVTLRGYKIIEFNNLMLRRLEPGESPSQAGGLDVAPTAPGEEAAWGRVVAQGFSNSEDPPPELLDVLLSSPSVSQCFLARAKGEIVAGAAMAIRDRVALLYGDATRLPARGLGAQTALLHARLQAAVAQGADLAMACVLPGSGSHRNYERTGFELFFMRVNLSREL